MAKSGRLIASFILSFAVLASAFAISAISESDNANEPDSQIVSGVSVHNLTTRDVSMIEEANFSWVRIDLRGAFDAYAHAASNKNLNILAIVGTDGLYKSSMSTWNKTIREDVAKYCTIVSAWEILNEPAVDYFTQKPGIITEKQYFNLIAASYEIIKGIDPDAKVVAFGGIRVMDGVVLDNSWVSDLVSMGILDYCDAVSVHIYTSFTNPMSISLEVRSGIRAVESLVGNKDVWITETGQPSDMDPSTFINTVYPIFESAGIRHVFWYEFRDWVPDFGHYFGLLDVNFTPRDSYYALKGWNLNHTAELA